MFAHRWLMVLVVAAVAALPASAAPDRTSPQAAASFVDALAKETLAVLRSKDGTLDERESKVRELLRDNFDLRLIGRFVMGKGWKKATREQRAEYQRVFAEYLLRTYSQRLGGYAREEFKIVKSEPLGKRDALVTTEISRPSGPPLLAGWRVRGGADGHHRILDVVVQGISMVATQRSEFAALIRRAGVEGLIEALRMQVTKFAARSS